MIRVQLPAAAGTGTTVSAVSHKVSRSARSSCVSQTEPKARGDGGCHGRVGGGQVVADYVRATTQRRLSIPQKPFVQSRSLARFSLPDEWREAPCSVRAQQAAQRAIHPTHLRTAMSQQQQQQATSSSQRPVQVKLVLLGALLPY